MFPVWRFSASLGNHFYYLLLFSSIQLALLSLILKMFIIRIYVKLCYCVKWLFVLRIRSWQLSSVKWCQPVAPQLCRREAWCTVILCFQIKCCYLLVIFLIYKAELSIYCHVVDGTNTVLCLYLRFWWLNRDGWGWLGVIPDYFYFFPFKVCPQFGDFQFGEVFTVYRSRQSRGLTVLYRYPLS